MEAVARKVDSWPSVGLLGTPVCAHARAYRTGDGWPSVGLLGTPVRVHARTYRTADTAGEADGSLDGDHCGSHGIAPYLNPNVFAAARPE